MLLQFPNVNFVSICPVLQPRTYMPVMFNTSCEQALRSLEPIVVRNPSLWPECNVLMYIRTRFSVSVLFCVQLRFQLYVIDQQHLSVNVFLNNACFHNSHDNLKEMTTKKKRRTRRAFSNRATTQKCSFSFLSELHAAPSRAAEKVTSSRDFVNVYFVRNLPASFLLHDVGSMVQCSFQMESQPINNNKTNGNNKKVTCFLSPTPFCCEIIHKERWHGGSVYT